MTPTKEKSLPLAIGLNLLLPGLGYIYMGKWLVGIAGCLVVVGAYLTTALLFLIPTWLVLNTIMVIDMVILFNKHKQRLLAENTRKCPNCAELIQKEARACRFCGAKVESR